MKKHNILKYLRFAFYIVTIGVMWYIPARKIIAIEAPATPPLTVDFKIQGHDPYDPGRGHYLAIRFVPIKLNKKKFKDVYSQRYYIVLKQGKDGFAEIEKVQDTCPTKGKYVKCHVNYSSHILKKNGYEVSDFPWKRFYINEELARPAEQILQKAVIKSDCRLRVKLYDGGGSAVEDLLINGKSIRELAKEYRKGK